MDNLLYQMLAVCLPDARDRADMAERIREQARPGESGFDVLVRRGVLPAEILRVLPLARTGVVSVGHVASSLTIQDALRRAADSMRRGDAAPDTLRGYAPGTDTAEADLPVLPGSRLGRYTVEGRVGVGGMSEVFRATHPTLEIPVAIKVLHADRSTAAEADHSRNLLRTEARTLARLNHPHIVRVLDFDEHEGRPYVVLEFVDGPSLGDLLKLGCSFTYRTVGRIAEQVVAALEAAAALGVTHRDVKPANLMVTPEGVCKVCDFGISRHRGAGEREDRERIEGTAAYVSPEQAANRPVDARSDMYSLGVTLFQLLTGTLPYRGPTAQVLLQHQTAEVPSARDRAAYVPGPVSTFVMRLMAKRPEDRFESYAEARAALADAIEAAKDSRAGFALAAPDSSPSLAAKPRKPAPAPAPGERPDLPDGGPVTLIDADGNALTGSVARASDGRVLVNASLPAPRGEARLRTVEGGPEWLVTVAYSLELDATRFVTCVRF